MLFSDLDVKKLKEANWRDCVIHVFVDSRPLCKFTDKPIGCWPAGHVWVDRTRSHVATCAQCLKTMTLNKSLT